MVALKPWKGIKVSLATTLEWHKNKCINEEEINMVLHILK